MFKGRILLLLLILSVALPYCSASSISGQIGQWRVEVGPPGNEFYDPSADEKIDEDSSDPSEVNEPAIDQKKFEKLLKEELGPYRERFNFENQIGRLARGPRNKDGSFRYVVIGDSRSNWELWPNIVKHIDSLDPKPAFVIHVGDVVKHGYPQEYRDYYIQALLETDIPFFVAIGNHDYGYNGKAREYRYLFGQKALNYSFDYGRARYIFIDNVTKVRPYEETLEWLDEILASTPKNFRKYVCVHKPPKNIEKWSYHAWDSERSKMFTDLMEKHNVSEVYMGHIHAYSTACYNGINYTVSGGGGATLHGRFGLLGSAHQYIICDIGADGSVKQQIVRFYKNSN
jgi:Icc protein